MNNLKVGKGKSNITKKKKTKMALKWHYICPTLMQTIDCPVIPVLIASLAICTAIFDKLDIFSAVLMASFTTSSAGNTLLTRPTNDGKKFTFNFY